jgi:hypothetical protein
MVSIDLVHVYKIAPIILDILEGLTIFHKIKTAKTNILDLFYGPWNLLSITLRI